MGSNGGGWDEVLCMDKRRGDSGILALGRETYESELTRLKESNIHSSTSSPIEHEFARQMCDAQRTPAELSNNGSRSEIETGNLSPETIRIKIKIRNEAFNTTNYSSTQPTNLAITWLILSQQTRPDDLKLPGRRDGDELPGKR